MILRLLSLLLSLSTMTSILAWSPTGDKIKTRWASTVNPENVWREYPRPQMQRPDWENLNGLWQYAITPKDAHQPTKWDGEILVPFCIESSLSGVQRAVDDTQALWYKRFFTVPTSWKAKDILLHFGAVDWECEVWVNGTKVGGHRGGYTPFSLNLTAALNTKGPNELVVRVWDPTDKGFQPVGKQTLNPRSIWYTAVTGIWQTVWLEAVSPLHISNVRFLPDIDKKTLRVDVMPSAITPNQMVEVTVLENGVTVAHGKSINGESVEIDMPDDVKLWSPDAPNLYDVRITLVENGKPVDTITSYAAMRKISAKRDSSGKMRMQLNNEDLFQYGPLDQGWWPDGLYTAPSYEALVYDIDKTKDLGFNMIRKHVKVEPALWYAHCDKIGMLVWQDMPSGDNHGPSWQNKDYYQGAEFNRSSESEANYRQEWTEIMDFLYNCPSVVTWVPFNESWGQFKTAEISDWTKAKDSSRLVNPASGGNFFPTGDILDLHQYPAPKMYLYDGQRVNVLGEFGGIGLVKEGHVWTPDRNWGYVEFKNEKEVTDTYVDYVKQLIDLVDDGFSAGVYTQTTDVEIEVNGLMTYDREKVKVEEDRVRAINRELVNSLSTKKK